MIPIDFWASFDPWATAMNPDDPSWSTRNPLFTVVGRRRMTSQVRTTIRVNPPSIPTRGEMTSAFRVSITPWEESRSARDWAAGPPDQIRWHQTDPTRAPIKAWDELDGIP